MTGTHAAELARDGYTVVRGLLPAALLGEFGQQLDAALDLPGPGTALDRIRSWRPTEQQHLALRAAGYRTRAQHDIAHHPALAGLMAELLGGQVWVQPRQFLRLMYTVDRPWATEPHQDYRFVQGTVDTLTAWIGMHDVDAGGSALRVLPGSHRRGLWPVTDTTGGTLPHPVGVFPDDPRWTALPVRAGDVAVFHSLTVHSTLPPAGPAGRLSLDVRYQRTGTPFAETGLLAPYDCEHSDDPARWTHDPHLNIPAGLQLVSSAPHDQVPEPDLSTSLFLEGSTAS